MKEKISFWRTKLNNLTQLVLPTDFPRPIPSKVVESCAICEIPETTSLAILKLSLLASQDKSSVTPFSILLAAFSVLLARHTGEEDISLGSSYATQNPLVLRFNVKKTDTLIDIIKKVKETEQEAADHEVTFQSLLQALEVSSDQPLFKVRFFNVTDTNDDTLQTSSNCDMSCFITQSNTLRRILPIQIRLVYNSVLFAHQRMTDLLDQLVQIIEISVENPLKTIEDVSLVTENSCKVLPNPKANLNWNGFEGAITDLFSKNACMHPDKTCVVESVSDSLRTFTYQQIHHASNLVSHFLIEQGIEREDVVVLYSYRGVDLVIAIMGVLKAGATFSVIGISN